MSNEQELIIGQIKVLIKKLEDTIEENEAKTEKKKDWISGQPHSLPPKR